MHQCANHPLPDRYGRAFLIGVLLNTSFVIVEAGFGYWTESLALLADAGHNLSDVLGLLMAWAGYSLAKVTPDLRHSYGWRGTTILAALSNSLLLLLAVGGITWEAIERLQDPASVDAPVVIAVAAIGVFINTGTALLFAKGRKSDLNLRGAYLHMAADALLSLGVVIAGVVIWLTGNAWIDPLISLLIGVFIFLGTWNLLRESITLAIHAVPTKIDPNDVLKYLEEIPGVTDVHDLHIWAISTTEVALTAHLERPNQENDDALLLQIRQVLHDRFGICHSTIQIERNIEHADCGQSADGTL